MKKHLLFVLIAFLTLSCTTTSKVATTATPTQGSELLSEVFTRLSGTFSSEAQHINDSSFFHINLKMKPIWTKKPFEGYWLYVEQAMAGKESAPYRQRLYHLVMKSPTEVESHVYTLSDPAKVKGWWATPNKFDDLDLNDIALKDGCSITLHASGSVYKGSTDASSCPSELKGASYAKSLVTLTANKMIAWDRGYNKKGEQVWGSEKGGYEFTKIEQW